MTLLCGNGRADTISSNVRLEVETWLVSDIAGIAGIGNCRLQVWFRLGKPEAEVGGFELCIVFAIGVFV